MIVDAPVMKEFERPPDGVHDAVLADVVDLGEKATQFGPKRKYQFIWLLTGLDSEKKNFQVQKQMNATMFQGSKPGQKNSQLFDTSKSVLGAEPKTPFDTDTLIGKNNQLVIENQTAQDGKRIFANVIAIMKPKVAFPVPAGYVRKKDRTTTQGTQAQTAAPAAAPAAAAADVADEDIPF